MSAYRPTGIVASAITPFHDDETLDLDGLTEHLEFLVSAGVSAVAVIGGSGEYVSLSADERREVVEVAVAAVGERVPVMVGCLAASTRETLSTASMAARSGAEALLVLPPYYIAPSRDGVIDHFLRVASESGLSVVAYNNPARTARPIDVEMLSELADVPGVVGVKDCDRDLGDISAKIARVGTRIAFLCGDDDLVFPSLMVGAAGAVMALPNLAPRVCCRLFDACVGGDLTQAQELHEIVRRLVHVRRGPNHPGPLKEMMSMVGRPVGLGRHPLGPMGGAERAAAEGLLRDLGPRLGQLEQAFGLMVAE